MRRNKIRFIFRIVKSGEIVQRYDCSSKRRFRNHIGTIKWQNEDFSVFLRVKYGDGYDNAGVYRTKEDLLFALDAFADSAITKYLYE